MIDGLKEGAIAIDFDDPMLVIGDSKSDKDLLLRIQEQDALCRAESIRNQIRRSKATHFFELPFTDKSEFILLIFDDSESSYRINIQSFSSRNYAWEVGKNPESWRINPIPSCVAVNKNPSNWQLQDFIREIGHFPPVSSSQCNQDTMLGTVSGHYSLLMLWLYFDYVAHGQLKERLRNLLYHTVVVDIKPYWNLSKARRDFAFEIFPRSGLAQRCESEDHLWFFMEYVGCLEKYTNVAEVPGAEVPGKVEIRRDTTQWVRQRKADLDAAKKGDLPEILTIDETVEKAEDWRFFLNDLLVQEAIRLVWEEEGGSSDLYRHCKKFLNAIAHFNAVTGGSSPHVVIKQQKPEDMFTRKGGRGKAKKPKKTPVCKVL